MRNATFVVLSGADTGSLTGSAFNVNQVVSASFVPTFGDATAAGTFKIQASNDFPIAGQLAPFTPTNWADIPNATSTAVAGVAPAIVIANMCFQFIRVVYTRTGGGSTTAVVNMNVLSV